MNGATLLGGREQCLRCGYVSSGATLTVLGPYFNPPVFSNGYNGKWLSLALNNWAGGTLYSATSRTGRGRS
jgi:hypothetical protein